VTVPELNTMSSAMSSALSRLAKAKRKWWRDTHPDQGEFSQESWDLQETVRLRNDQNKVWSVVSGRERGSIRSCQVPRVKRKS
jgi:hypothetical protein